MLLALSPEDNAAMEVLIMCQTVVNNQALICTSDMQLYRNKEARDNAVVPPYKWLRWKNWTLVHIVNIHIAIFYLG
jgi:hypothetical protein